MIPFCHEPLRSAVSAWGSAPRSHRDHQTRLKDAVSRNILLQNTDKGARIGSLNGKFVIPKGDRQRLKLKYFHHTRYKGGQATLRKLLLQPVSVLKKIQRIWEPTERKLELAFPNGTKEVQAYVLKWWCLLVNAVIDGGMSRAISYYKKFSSSLFRHFGGLIQDRSGIPLSNREWGDDPFPMSPKETWMEKDPEDLSRGDKIKCKILAETRDLPPADSQRQKEMLEQHRLTTVEDSPGKVNRKTSSRIIKYASIAAAEIWTCNAGTNFMDRKTGHISISSSSCYEQTRDEGGKRTFIINELEKFANLSWDKEELALGAKLANGQYRLQSPMGDFIIIDGAEPRNFAFGGDCEFGEPDPDNPEGPPLGYTKEIISKMTFYISWLYLVKHGYLDRHGNHTGKPYDTKCSTLGEPGNKARIVTRSAAMLITFLQPMAHVGKQLLMEDPSLRSGFQAANQLGEFSRRLKCYMTESEAQGIKDLTWLYGDYDTATDRFDRGKAEIAMRCLFPRGAFSKYVDASLDIVLGTWLREGVPTVRGIPMGMPITKVILHFVGKCIEVDSKRITSPRSKDVLKKNTFSLAGDDLVNIDSLDVNLRFIETVPEYGLLPSDEKWGIYKLFGKFCEMLCITSDGGELGYPTSMYEGVFVDTPKMRLASSETKFTRGDNDRIPFWGKSRDLAKQRSHLTSYGRVERNFEPYAGMYQLWHYGLLQSSIRHIGQAGAMHWSNFIPIPLGGRGFQINDLDTFLVDYVPNWFIDAISVILMKEGEDGFDLNTFQVVSRSVGAFGLNTILSRGLEKGEVRPELEMYFSVKDGLDEVEEKLLFQHEAYEAFLENNPNHVRDKRKYTQRSVLEENGWVDVMKESELAQLGNVWNQTGSKQKRGYKKISHSMREKKLQLRLAKLGLAHVQLSDDLIARIVNVSHRDVRNDVPTWIKRDQFELLGQTVRPKTLAHSVSLCIPNSQMLQRSGTEFETAI